jgi:hypothetical protein
MMYQWNHDHCNIDQVLDQTTFPVIFSLETSWEPFYAQYINYITWFIVDHLQEFYDLVICTHKILKKTGRVGDKREL